MSTIIRRKYFIGILLLTMSFAAKAQPPSVSISPSGPVVCAGTTLNAVINNLNPPYTYLWSTGATTATITLNQTNFIRVSVSGFMPNGNPRTVNSPWTPYLVIPNPNATVTPAGPLKLCPNETATLTANGGFFFSTYLWNDGSTTSSISVNQSGTYEVTITNSFFTCTTSSTSNAVEVEVFDASYEPAITADGPVTVCKPGYVPLHADSGFSDYLWSTGATSQAVNVLMNGLQQGPVLDTLTVYLTVTLNNNCSFTNNTGIVLRSIRQPHLRAADCGNFNLTTGDSIKSDLVLSYDNIIPQYEFEFEETTNPGVLWTHVSNNRWCNLSDVSPAIEAGKFYNVRVRAIIGGTPYCYGNYCQIGIVPNRPVANATTVSRTSGIAPVDASIFPNPSTDEFQLVLRNLNPDQQATVQVSDLSGRLMDQFIVDPASGSTRFGANLNNGVYMVAVKQGDNSTVTRIVKAN